MEIRPPSRTCIAWLKPVPSGPRRFSFGIRQSSMTSVAVSDALRPSLFSFLPERMPRWWRSTTKAEMPWVPAVLSVTAIRTAVSPTEPWVMKFFEPFRTHSFPSRTAVVFVPFESLPASDSVSPQAPIAFP